MYYDNPGCKKLRVNNSSLKNMNKSYCNVLNMVAHRGCLGQSVKIKLCELATENRVV